MSEFPYGAYVIFFGKWFGNPVFLAFAFLLWLGITIHWAFFAMKARPLWLRVPLVLVISAVHYLLFGLLFAPGYFGGEARFLYDPAHLSENLFTYHGWQLIVFWPFSLLPTGGYLIVLPLLLIGWGIWYSRSSRRRQPAE